MFLSPSADALSFPSGQNAQPFSNRLLRNTAGSCRSPHAPLVPAPQAARGAPLPSARRIQSGLAGKPARQRTASAAFHCAESPAAAALPANCQSLVSFFCDGVNAALRLALLAFCLATHQSGVSHFFQVWIDLAITLIPKVADGLPDGLPHVISRHWLDRQQAQKNFDA